MRFALIAASLSTLALSSQAATLPAQSCLALGSGISRVAATVADAAQCCTGRLQCAQFLSTNRVVRPAHDQHT